VKDGDDGDPGVRRMLDGVPEVLLTAPRVVGVDGIEEEPEADEELGEPTPPKFSKQPSQ
jgi:hypothetical protein